MRGQAYPAKAEDIALPPPGAAPVDIYKAVPTVRFLVDHMGTELLLPDDEVGWEGYSDVKSYQGPAFKDKAVLLYLPSRMCYANMIDFVATKREEVFFFTVVKKLLDSGRVALRLVWDLRKAHFRWRRAPRGSMGAPTCFGFIDLSEVLEAGRRLSSFSGDVPEVYYTCALPRALWGWFVVHGVSTREFVTDMREKEGVEIPINCDANPFIAMVVLGLGWSWACYFAQVILESVMDSGRAPEVIPSMRLSGVPITPLLRKMKDCMHWGLIDDCAGVLVGEDDDQQKADADAARVGKNAREAFRSFGWAVQKGAAGSFLTSLGFDLDWAQAIARASEAHLWGIRDATTFLLQKPYVLVNQVQRIVGPWVWVAMMTRCALSVFFVPYRWLGDHKDVEGGCS